MSLERQVLEGIAASPGLAVGKVVVFDRSSVPVPRRRVPDERIDAEVARLEAAMEAARREVEEVRDALPQDAGADHRLLLETQLMMHGDELLVSSATRFIREDRLNAEWALRRTVDRMSQRLRAAPEPYFRERADDVTQVGEHVLRVLTGVSRSMPVLSEPTIFVASDLSPAEAAQLPPGLVRALVTDVGSASSHTALLARALQVPAVVGVREVTRWVGPGDTIIVDALRGEVVLFADDEELTEAGERAERFEAFRGRLRESERRAAETRDGIRVGLFANVELELDVGHAKSEGADGLGLYRTEFLYLDRSTPPSEEEQTALYRRVARRIAPKDVTFRTFDLGADKMPRGVRGGPNPALGLRALRVAFEQPELLVTQLRALLRASVDGNVRVMFPMVNGLSDLRRARVLFERARDDLDAEGAAYGPVAVGAMLEVPSAVLVADRLAPECDFFSVGTNDLTQYTLAVDRSDPRVAHLARPLDPAVLRLLDRARAVAEAHEVPISVCGDLAADPVATPVLLGLGFRTLSMPMGAIPLIREVVSRIDGAEAAALAAEALDQDDANEVERLVAGRFGEAVGELWREQGIELPRG
ncbi:MAG TPA: phosphoenolpyruvate--protein phosphotransferase [Sandaracinaceae bacterium LLY-WYZ-13_1]|nr:phosphoenolpyruvate--protein phosphotransferase [Sandaracinaceae bacterium LLY-WYZ-13_1]